MENGLNYKKRHLAFSIKQPASIVRAKRNSDLRSSYKLDYLFIDKEIDYRYFKSSSAPSVPPHKKLKEEQQFSPAFPTGKTQNHPCSHHLRYPCEPAKDIMWPLSNKEISQENKGDEEYFDSEEIFHLSIDYPPIRSSIKLIDINLKRYNTDTLHFKQCTPGEYEAIFLVRDYLSLKLTSRILVKDGKAQLLLRDGTTESFKSPEDFISRYINKLIANCEKVFDHRNFGKLVDKDFKTMDFFFRHLKDTTFEVIYSPLRTRKIIKEIITTIHHGFKFRNRLFLSLEEVIESLKGDSELMDRSQKRRSAGCTLFSKAARISNARRPTDSTSIIFPKCFNARI